MRLGLGRFVKRGVFLEFANRFMVSGGGSGGTFPRIMKLIRAAPVIDFQCF